MKGGEGWMGKFPFKPLFLRHFFPQFGEEKKTPQNGGLGEKTLESTKINTLSPPLPHQNQTRALFKIPLIFLFPCSISPKSTKRALVDAKYQSHSLINCVIFMYVFVDNNLMPLLYDYLLLLILP